MGKTADVCLRHGRSPATFHKSGAQHGCLQVSEARRLRVLEAQNAWLKKLLADALLDNAMLNDVASKK